MAATHQKKAAPTVCQKKANFENDKKQDHPRMRVATATARCRSLVPPGEALPCEGSFTRVPWPESLRVQSPSLATPIAPYAARLQRDRRAAVALS